MSTAINFDIKLDPIVRGKAVDYTLSLSSIAGALVVADIEDVVVTFKADPLDADDDKILQKSLGSGINLTGVSGDNVLALLQLTNADTALFTAGKVYFLDIQVDTTSRGAETAAGARVLVRQPITQSN